MLLEQCRQVDRAEHRAAGYREVLVDLAEATHRLRGSYPVRAPSPSASTSPTTVVPLLGVPVASRVHRPAHGRPPAHRRTSGLEGGEGGFRRVVAAAQPLKFICGLPRPSLGIARENQNSGPM